MLKFTLLKPVLYTKQLNETVVFYTSVLGFFSGSLYITTNEVDELGGALKDKCRVCDEVENFEYGMREFAIYDNNGYLLQFGQPVNV